MSRLIRLYKPNSNYVPDQLEQPTQSRQRAVEATLDAFWEEVIAHICKDTLLCTRARDILLTRQPERTPAWIEPHKKNQVSADRRSEDSSRWRHRRTIPSPTVDGDRLTFRRSSKEVVLPTQAGVRDSALTCSSTHRRSPVPLPFPMWSEQQLLLTTLGLP
ncbi:hypothetical protein F4818DRAFT_397875 [Hypoxylon cercidicola]|nr:hypothetical protein F4818DRAFT_397875 [Hypoxylon cercidicola]